LRETDGSRLRILFVKKTLRIVSMILVGVAVALAVLALITQLGVIAIERIYRPSGQMIDVTGGRLHVVDLGPRDGTEQGPPLVLIHGASSNLQGMLRPLGDRLAGRYRVILIDRPGHGWSTRERLTDSTPAIQAAMIDEALGKLGVARAVFVVHSWAGALGPAMALDHPSRVAGLVMLAPVTHPWRGGVAWYNDLAAKPVAGWLFAHTVAFPAGLAMMEPGATSVFLPQTKPAHYVRDTAVALLLRPAEFMANAHDMVTLKASVAAQVHRYGAIKTPVVVIAGDADTTVPINVHARPFVAVVPNAKLVVLPGVGHLVQNAAPDVVIDAIDAMMAEMTSAPQAAVR
jgi:pimeloyl-ACP methyl ester carboxylesterase